MTRPDLTVAICTHENAKMLDRALARLAAQRVGIPTTWEVVVVDNASADETSEVLRAWVERRAFPRLCVVREERLGLAHARRAAFAAASADLIAFVDDDCLLDPKWVAAAVAFARERPRAGAFGGRVRLLWEGEPSRLARECEWALARQERGEAAVRLADRGCDHLVGAGLVVRRDALEQSGWIQRGKMMGRTGKALTGGDDAEISLRIRAAGWELWYTPALHIDHVLPAWRGDYEYLARLHRSIGRALPYTWIVGGLYERTAWIGPVLAARSLASAARRAISALYHRARGERLYAQRRLLNAHRSLGCFLGALRLPPRDDASARSALPGASGAALPEA